MAAEKVLHFSKGGGGGGGGVVEHLSTAITLVPLIQCQTALESIGPKLANVFKLVYRAYSVVSLCT